MHSRSPPDFPLALGLHKSRSPHAPAWPAASAGTVPPHQDLPRVCALLGTRAAARAADGRRGWAGEDGGALEGGAVGFLQLFGGALQPHPHYHLLLPEGLWQSDGTFVALPPPEDADVTAVLHRVLRRLRSRWPTASPSTRTPDCTPMTGRASRRSAATCARCGRRIATAPPRGRPLRVPPEARRGSGADSGSAAAAASKRVFAPVGRRAPALLTPSADALAQAWTDVLG